MAARESEEAFEALAEGALRGSLQEAWALFEQAWPALESRLATILRSLGISRNLAEDCGQAVLLRVWRSRDGYRGESAAELFGWIHRIAQNESRRLLEREARGPRLEADLSEDSPGAETLPSRGTEDSTAGAVEARDEEAALEECMEDLDGRQRAVIELIYSASPATEREAAELLGQSKSYVNVLRQKALHALAICLGRKGIE